MNTLTPEEISVGFRLLFDGCSLDGFRSYRSQVTDPRWQVRNQTIVLTEGGAGDLITRETFGDFELRLEFQISPDGNSGVLWHVTEEGQHPYESGPEFQILDSFGRDAYQAEIAKGNVSGALYDIIPTEPGHTLPAGEWNDCLIRIEGPRIRLVLNGHVTADIDSSTADWATLLGRSKFHDWPLFNKSPTGHVSLQDHNDIVAFRTIRIRELH